MKLIDVDNLLLADKMELLKTIYLLQGLQVFNQTGNQEEISTLQRLILQTGPLNRFFSANGKHVQAETIPKAQYIKGTAGKL